MAVIKSLDSLIVVTMIDEPLTELTFIEAFLS